MIKLFICNCFLILVLNQSCLSQEKENYLKQNVTEFTENFKFPKNIEIVGFGAYHGSAKTEDAEILMVTSLIKNNDLAFYFPETDVSIAHYFNEYLKTGDEELLKDLITTYGVRVPQESTKEVFLKWKKLKALNDKLPEKKKIRVLGADPIVTYKYTFRHLLSLINDHEEWEKALQLQATVQNDTTDFSPYYESYSKRQLKEFLADYESSPSKYNSLIKDMGVFSHLVHTIKVSFDDNYHREKEMYSNYLTVCKLHNCKGKLQFFRLGFSHLLKAKTGRSGSFFSMLVENNVCPKEKIISVIGYLTKSEVLWSNNYDDDGNFISSVTKGDDGIEDSEAEYFKGIGLLKKLSKGNMTLFKLDEKGSPYTMKGCTDMVEFIQMPPRKAIDYGTNTSTDFLNYALLISNSPASRSIYEPK